ncbi:MAG: hypothetical protein AAF497_23405, partial [Planctomycetota bacterium]
MTIRNCFLVWIAIVVTSTLGYAETRFDVNDVAILWPVPETVADVNNRISAGETLLGGESLWPANIFNAVITTAQQTSVESSFGFTHPIRFDGNKLAFENVNTWRVASLRLDPSAPGTSDSIQRVFGSKPQLRLVLQPVTTNGFLRVHDFSAHLVFDFVKSTNPPLRPGLPPRSVPDKERFSQVLRDFAKLYKDLGIDTSGKLGIHPGTKNNVSAFNDGIRSILRKHLKASDVNTMAFMGLDPPEPWIFFGMRKSADGTFRRLTHPSVGTAQMFSRRGGRAVMPRPANRNLSPTQGVSTATLFADSRLDRQMFPGSTDPKLASVLSGDIPDIIENPNIAHVASTDCVSCHTSSSLRD